MSAQYDLKNITERANEIIKFEGSYAEEEASGVRENVLSGLSWIYPI
jgi:hypothetical protein